MKNHFPDSHAEIHLGTILNNLRTIHKRAGTEKVFAVVKCDAYRHGAVRVSRHIEDAADWFGVASVDEGIQLRMGGLKKPILVFNVPGYDTAAAYHTHNLTATVSHKTHFDTLMDGTRYQLNFDTGMGRFGFMPEDAADVRQLAVMNQRLSCSGIYSHYATADDPGSDFVRKQYERFSNITELFKEIPLRHMSNTGAVANYDIGHFNMVRTGVGMLGYNSGEKRYDWLKPALTWKTRIVQIRKIKKETPVSYSSTWKAPQEGYLATIPVGYGDGIPRSLSNKLKVWIDGELYPQVGNVTMDNIMVFLGEKQLPAETEVTLLGGEGWNAHDWAEKAGTNVHEILTNITGRVEKIYGES
ncbi:alanine racemase [Rhodohalobacter mucosus]|uniref:alanine racemase n=1 Tax=Rhodohalobacter mucosus TaxID=2079485 RepID=UPI001304A9B8|nr:alanine racemase [Rhodohalobacter mucosus]